MDKSHLQMDSMYENVAKSTDLYAQQWQQYSQEATKSNQQDKN